MTTKLKAGTGFPAVHQPKLWPRRLANGTTLTVGVIAFIATALLVGFVTWMLLEEASKYLGLYVLTMISVLLFAASFASHSDAAFMANKHRKSIAWFSAGLSTVALVFSLLHLVEAIFIRVGQILTG